MLNNEIAQINIGSKMDLLAFNFWFISIDHRRSKNKDIKNSTYGEPSITENRK